MLEELLKHSKLGSEDEIYFVISKALSLRKTQNISDLKKFCSSNLYSISQSFDGIIALLQFIDFVEISDDQIILRENLGNEHNIDAKQKLSSNFLFFESLLSNLKKSGFYEELFNAETIKLNKKSNLFYIKDNLIPYKFFPVRNLLLSLNFLVRDPKINNHLNVRNQFSDFFRIFVVNDLVSKVSKRQRKSLKSLKNSLEAREKAGLEAEKFVLKFEKKRLNDHPQIDKIKRISDDFTNAGYDIESFDDNDSVIIDRFIEVKSYSKELIFYWTKNEFRTAKELGSSYYLYLINRDLSEAEDYKPIMFKNPCEEIFGNNDWKKEIENLKITQIKNLE